MPTELMLSGLRLVGTGARSVAAFLRHRGRMASVPPGAVNSALASLEPRILAEIGVLRCDVIYGAGLRADLPATGANGASAGRDPPPYERQSLRHAPWARFSVTDAGPRADHVENACGPGRR